MNHNLTQELLLHLFNYDENTGKLFWKNPKRKEYTGLECGTFDGRGYRQVRVNGRLELVHRLIWIIKTGKNPTHQIDHINGIRTDNRFSNLRDVTSRENQNNMIQHRNFHLVGAHYSPRTKKWQAKIKIKGKTVHLGYFLTAKLAHDAYIAKKLNWSCYD